MNWHDVFTYNPKSGDLVWKDGRRHAGRVAGCVAQTLQGNRYIKVKCDGRQYWAHRVIWEMQTGRPPAKWIDHINGDGTDNRWCNLREASPSENGYNRKVDVRNKVGVTGVHFDPKRDRYKVSITTDGVRHHLGSFKSLREAVRVSKEARARLHGEFRLRKRRD